MCERTEGARRGGLVGHVLLAAAVGAGALAGPLQGQDGLTAAARQDAEVVARIDLLLERYRAAGLAAREAETAAAARALAERIALLETVAVGPVRILTRPADAARVRELFRGTWEADFAWLGDAAAERVAAWTFGFLGRGSGDDVALPEQRAHALEVRPWTPAAWIDRGIRDGLARAVSEALPADVAAWTAGVPLQRPGDWSSLHRRLALTPNGRAHACWQGDPEACWIALGAVPSADPWREWLTAAERRAAVARMRWFEPEQRAACLGEGDDEACIRALSAGQSGTSAIPLSPALRVSLLWMALEMGGEGALDRLIQETGSTVDLRDRLARVAGTTPEALIGAWRGRLLASRPDPGQGALAARLSASFWILLFTLLATRSTRWR